ncbi:MAG: TetR/AcrR family transcriptional regulator, partial [Sphaerochaetaceae bacterium]
MNDTKELILQTALGLFSQNGYKATSVSMIADAVGVTKGALYKHYRNKQAILDSIVDRIYQMDAENA